MADYGFNTAITPGRPAAPTGPYGSVFPHAGMSVQELLALAMGQEAYRRGQQQMTADAMAANPGALLGLLRGGVAPGMAQAAVGQQGASLRGPALSGPDPMLDLLAANQFERQSDFLTNEAVFDFLEANKPGFMDKFGAPLLALGGMALGGGVGGLAGAQMGGSVGNILAQLVANRY